MTELSSKNLARSLFVKDYIVSFCLVKGGNPIPVMFRLRSSNAGRRSPTVANTSGESSSKRFRSTTLAAILVLLFSPSPSLSVPLVARRSSLAARSTIDFDDQSSVAAAGDVGAERVFFPSATEGSEVNAKRVIRATIGETAVLECEAGGSPGPTIHWVHHGQRILQVLLFLLFFTFFFTFVNSFYVDV